MFCDIHFSYPCPLNFPIIIACFVQYQEKCTSLFMLLTQTSIKVKYIQFFWAHARIVKDQALEGFLNEGIGPHAK